MTDAPKKPAPQVSIVVPFFNEEENILSLYQEIYDVLKASDIGYEMVFINDGSQDETLARLNEIAQKDYAVRVVDLLRNYGQTAAMTAGFDAARGDIIVTMDGDGQNDPADIPRLLDKLNEGYDLVSGWRSDRQDKQLSRKMPSMVANHLISAISGVRLHDYGCSMKAYRRDIIQNVRLYGEMHRFIPIYSSWHGGRITEIEVNHRPRLNGSSKYDLSRIFKVLLDLMLVMFMERYMTKPIYIFGGLGIVAFVLALLCSIWAVWLKVFADTSFIQTPLPVLIGTFFTTSIVCILMGLLAELLMRTYFESQNKKIYMSRKHEPDEKA